MNTLQRALVWGWSLLPRCLRVPAARVGLNTAILPNYGTMSELKIDPEKQEISATFMLHGEPEPIRIDVAGYTLFPNDPDAGIEIQKIHISRAWMNALAATVAAPGKRVKIPAEYAQILAQIL